MSGAPARPLKNNIVGKVPEDILFVEQEKKYRANRIKSMKLREGMTNTEFGIFLSLQFDYKNGRLYDIGKRKQYFELRKKYER